jgi:CBS domain-containing protein
MPKSFITLWTGALFVATLLLLADAGTALAARRAPSTAALGVTDPLHSATVNLYCRLKAGKTLISSSGSGVLIHERGVILTNAHVAQYWLLAAEKGRVTGWCRVRTGSPAQETYTAEILYLPPAWLAENIVKNSTEVPSGSGENDFALLYITGVHKKKIPLPIAFPALSLDAGTVAERTGVSIAGYPSDGLDFSQMRNKLIRVTASSTVTAVARDELAAADRLTLASSVVAKTGVSGGPVVDERGRVIGIVTAKSAHPTEPTLRAITGSYIDRSLLAQTGHSITRLLAGDLAAQATTFAALIPPDTISTFTHNLRLRR